MSVRLESSTKRYIGMSTDMKPKKGVYVDGVTCDTIPVGSSFMEEDTGKKFLFDGADWVHPSMDAGGTSTVNVSNELLVAMLFELRQLKERIFLTTS